MKPTAFLRRFLAITGSAVLTISYSHAATLYWDVNGSTANFSTVVGAWNGTSSFWNTDATGGAGGSLSALTTAADDIVISQATTNTGSITTTGAQVASSITFAPNVGPTTTITGTAITIGGTGALSGVFQQSSGANTISAGLTLNSANTAFNFSNSGSGLLTLAAVTGAATSGTQTITIGASSTGGITLGGIIGNGAGGGNVALAINSSGAGITTLSGANTYTGGTTITAGTVKVGNSGNVLGANSSAVSVVSGAVLDMNGWGMSGTNALSLNGSGIGGTGALLNSGGTAARYSGPITLASASTIGNTTAAVLTLGSSGNNINTNGFLLTLKGTGQINIPGNGWGITGGGGVTVDGLYLSLIGSGVNSTNTLHRHDHRPKRRGYIDLC